MLSTTDRDRILKGQTAAAKKVLDAVPIEQSWTSSQVMSELRRRQQGTMDFNILEGCLNTLKDAGLVKETVRGQFCQAPVRRRSVTILTPFPGTTHEESAALMNPVLPASAQAIQQAEAEAPQSLMDRIGSLAMRANQLATQAAQLTTDLEDLAIEVQAKLEANEADTLRLKQLRELLKGV